jgi:hypothetical protein
VCQRHTEITGYTIAAQTRTNPRSTNNFAYLTGRNFGLEHQIVVLGVACPQFYAKNLVKLAIQLKRDGQTSDR